MHRTLTDFFTQVDHAMTSESSGPDAYAMLRRLIATTFDNTDQKHILRDIAAFWGIIREQSFAFFATLRILVSSTSGSKRVLSPSPDVVLETVRNTVAAQFPNLMPSSYHRSLDTTRVPFGTIDAIWLALDRLATNKSPANTGPATNSSNFPHLRSFSGIARTSQQGSILTAIVGGCLVCRYAIQLRDDHHPSADDEVDIFRASYDSSPMCAEYYY